MFKKLFDKMFTDVGGKFQSIAKLIFGFIAVIFVIMAFATWITFISAMGILGFLLGILVAGILLVFGIISAWISAIALYALGQVIKNTDRLVELQEQAAAQASSSSEEN